MGERITVEEGRKAILVTSWGQRPLGVYLDKKGVSFVVPHGYTCRTKEAKKDLIGESSVESEGARAKFRFSSADFEVIGEWKDNPTAALDCVQAKMNNKKHRVGANGLLVFGCTYPSLQLRIRGVFDVGMPLTCSRTIPVPVQTRARSRVVQEETRQEVKRQRRTVAVEEEEDDESMSFLDLDLNELVDEDVVWLDTYFEGKTDVMPSEIPSVDVKRDSDRLVVVNRPLPHVKSLPPMARVVRMTSVDTIPMMCSSMSDDEEPASDIGLVDRHYDEDDDEDPPSWLRKKQFTSTTTTTTAATSTVVTKAVVTKVKEEQVEEDDNSNAVGFDLALNQMLDFTFED